MNNSRSHIHPESIFPRARSKRSEIALASPDPLFLDFTYIDDIVDGIIRVIDNPAQPTALTPNPKTPLKPKNLPPQVSTAPYRLYNIGNNAPLPLMTFIETIENALGKAAEKNFMPMQDGDVVSTYADVGGLIDDIGYKPDTKLADGIGKFVKWYKGFYK